MLHPLLALLGCTAPNLDATPSTASSFGYVDVTFTVDDVNAADIASVQVGGIPAYDLRPGDGAITVTVQGSPVSGSVPVVFLLSDGESLTYDDAFTYEPPLADLGEVWAVGASVAMGAQGGAVDQWGQLRSPSAVVARQLGAYHPLPLLVTPFMPLIGAGDIGPAPECEVPDLDGFANTAAALALAVMEASDGPDFRLARVSPDLQPQNTSVAGTNMTELADGYDAGDFGQQFLAHLVLDPGAALLDPVRVQQLDVLEQGDPGIILLPDLIGNDLIDAVKASDVLDPSLARGPDQVGERLDTLIDGFAATGAQVFVANMPWLSTTPLAHDVARGMIEGGTPASEVDALMAEIDTITAELNDHLAAAGARHDNVHVIDAAAQVQEMVAGVQVGAETLTPDKFGGLISTDGVHFSDTGYALMANGFLDAIEDELGVSAPRADLEAVLATDRFSPAALSESGDCATGW